MRMTGMLPGKRPWSLRAGGHRRAPGRIERHPLRAMPWFVKTETIAVPAAQVAPHLEAHRAWVGRLREQGVRISSGYLVDGQGKPGGGGLLLLEAADHASAEALILQDPMVRSGSVRWLLHRWVAAVGDLDLG